MPMRFGSKILLPQSGPTCDDIGTVFQIPDIGLKMQGGFGTSRTWGIVRVGVAMG